MINNRQSGRRRGRGGGNGQRQGGPQGNGSRIDSRSRGNANQLYEKYKNMASDAQRAGDRVNTEYYLQFADHYFRVLSEQRGRFEDQQPRPRRDDFDYDGDDDFGDEGEPIRAGEQGDGARANGDDGRRDFRRDRETGDGRNDGNRNDGNRNDGPRNDGPRNDGPRNDGGRREWRDRNGEDRGPRRNGEYREQRPVPTPEVIAGQHRAEPLPAGESLEARAEEVLEADRPLDPPARRRGRPRADEAEGATDAGFGADRLPPSLTATAANDEGEAAPRRRRPRRPVDETPTAAE